MCGIFAVLREPGVRTPPSRELIEKLLIEAVHAAKQDASVNMVKGLVQAAEHLSELNGVLKGSAGVRSLIGDSALAKLVEANVATVDDHIAQIESDLDKGLLAEDVVLEELNQALVPLKDATWAIRRDRLRTVVAVAELAGSHSAPVHTIESYTSVQLALSAIDRLEVRGRDSAGVSIIINADGLVDSEIATEISSRQSPLFLSRSIDRSGDTLVFVYKAAAEIGALGDNVKGLRAVIVEDNLLRRVLQRPNVQAAVVAHTRWASVGTVSESNAHPVDQQELINFDGPCVLASLNGDVDNYTELKARWNIQIADDITTDAKVIPVMVSRRMKEGADFTEAFRLTVAQFKGSAAIAGASAESPDRIVLAVKGSGQGCYIGLAEDSFLVASEPYGLVEECSTYLRVDGEAVSTGSGSSGSKGQLIELRRQNAGTLGAITRFSYGGEELPISEDELVTAEVTTRDIDRGSATHFLLKEISESPQSIRRTLRGKIVESHGRLKVSLSEEAFPKSIRDALASGTIDRVHVIGQGTAATAGRALATVLESVAPGSIPVYAGLATELSGFGLRDDMTDTLVIAVSQSGTTTDTNRTVDLVRSRGAKVLAIVNRRQSDLTERADGVLYTSDGRDIEMAVASTKAFYSQVAAASLLAVAIADAREAGDRQICHELLDALRRLPDAMVKVLACRDEIGHIARRFAPHRRSWAIVGNGPNYIAAQELRIKLSELCYKSIAVDFTEDKKHIDLSAEPMIVVCAAGLTGANVSDVVKETAIYKAHKATAIVIASEGAQFDSAAATVFVPSLHPIVDFVLSTVAGHLFGYEAALAIDAQARLMRVARATLDDVVAASHSDDDRLLFALHSAMTEPARAIFTELESGALNGHLSPLTAVRVVSLLRYATGVIPLDALELETGRPTSPSLLATDLLVALSAAVDELTRPIDAVKHQAKTVTVGISRTEDTYVDNRLVAEAVTAGAKRERLSYRSMRTLAALEPGVAEVIGYTRYEVEGDPQKTGATIRVVDKGGVAADIDSRAELDPRLIGTKHRAAFERVVTVGRGARDGRSVIIVPEGQDRQVSAITLLHVKFAAKVDSKIARSVLSGYRQRYSALVDAVTETESDFDDALLAEISLLDLLVEPVWTLARKWRK